MIYHKLHGQSEKIKKLYESGQHTTTIAKKYKCDVKAIRYHLKKLNVEIRKFTDSHRKLPINERFFEHVDTEEKAYILGFLYADGYHDESKYQIVLSLASRDRNILFKIRNYLCPNGYRIAFNQRKKYKNAKPTHQNQYRLLLCSQRMSGDLLKLGLTQKKSFTITFPDVREDLINHFIRGYFDGDGSIHIEPKFKGASVSIISTRKFLESIKQIFNKEFSAYLPKLFQKKEQVILNKNIFSMQYHGTQIIFNIYDYLYKDATIFLNRKKKKFEKFLKFKKLL